MYGAVPLREIKSKLLMLRRAGKLDRVKMIALTNCTFDGIVYDVERVMEECLAIKPDLVFPGMRPGSPSPGSIRSCGRAPRWRARRVRDRLAHERRPCAEVEHELAQDAAIPTDDDLLDRRLRLTRQGQGPGVRHAVDPQDPDGAAAGSMIHVFDQDFDQKVAEAFHEAYMAHTSTSPNYQILASLDLGRRQVALEGLSWWPSRWRTPCKLRDAIDNHPLLSKYMACLRTADMIPDDYRPAIIEQPLRLGPRKMMRAWDSDEFALDPTRITLPSDAPATTGTSSNGFN